MCDFPFVLGPPILRSDMKQLSLFSHYDSRGKPGLRGGGWHAQSHTAVSREPEFKSQWPDMALGLPPLYCGFSSGQRVELFQRVDSWSSEFSKPLVPSTEVLKGRPWPDDHCISITQSLLERPILWPAKWLHRQKHGLYKPDEPSSIPGTKHRDNPFHKVVTWPPHGLRLATPQHPSLWQSLYFWKKC